MKNDIKAYKKVWMDSQKLFLREYYGTHCVIG